jgi:transposase InsO family protein
MARGFVYLTAVVDVASRKVLAHKVAITLEALHATEVIERAFARYGTPEIVNTDQGSQFTAEEFTRVVLARGCKLSMDGRGAWRDNVFVERLSRSVKYERVSEGIRQRERGTRRHRVTSWSGTTGIVLIAVWNVSRRIKPTWARWRQ